MTQAKILEAEGLSFRHQKIPYWQKYNGSILLFLELMI